MPVWKYQESCRYRLYKRRKWLAYEWVNQRVVRNTCQDIDTCYVSTSPVLLYIHTSRIIYNAPCPLIWSHMFIGGRCKMDQNGPYRLLWNDCPVDDTNSSERNCETCLGLCLRQNAIIPIVFRCYPLSLTMTQSTIIGHCQPLLTTSLGHINQN